MSMNDGLLEVGKIVNTHGVRGEMKVQSWCDGPEDLIDLETVYVGSKSYKVTHGRVHGQFALLTFEGIQSIDDAARLKNQIIKASRDEFDLEDGLHFVADLIGLEARHQVTGEVLGKVVDILEYPAQDLYVVQGEKRWLIPDVPQFVGEVNEEEGFMYFSPLEGMDQ